MPRFLCAGPGLRPALVCVPLASRSDPRHRPLPVRVCAVDSVLHCTAGAGCSRRPATAVAASQSQGERSRRLAAGRTDECHRANIAAACDVHVQQKRCRRAEDEKGRCVAQSQWRGLPALLRVRRISQWHSDMGRGGPPHPANTQLPLTHSLTPVAVVALLWSPCTLQPVHSTTAAVAVPLRRSAGRTALAATLCHCTRNGPIDAVVGSS